MYEHELAKVSDCINARERRTRERTGPLAEKEIGGGARHARNQQARTPEGERSPEKASAENSNDASKKRTEPSAR